MDCAIQNWLDFENYDKLHDLIHDRPVYIWGAFSNGKAVRDRFEQQGIRICGYIDGHKETTEYDTLPVVPPQHFCLDRKPYIIIAVMGVRTEIIDYLYSFRMVEKQDYIYISNVLPQFSLSYCGNDFRDAYGNEIIINDKEFKGKLEIVGYNNRIQIGKSFKCEKNTTIRVENGSNIIIGDYVEMDGDVEVVSMEGSTLKIGNNCRILKDSRLCAKGAHMIFGNYVTMGKRFLCINGKKADIMVGNDCMFANDVSVIASGGHDIFNLITKENESLRTEEKIRIGNHVWLGKNATVLYNSVIKDGCIVGANSLVKLETENNCIIAGNPARVIKTNHTWDRRQGIQFDEI